jgi:signal transduction histidine kinase
VLQRNLDLWSILIAPLTLDGKAIGALDILNKQPAFTEDDMRIVSLLADQAVIAIEKARLTAQSEQLAVMEERQRLARELHDSVSQALYGIGLGARTAKTLLDQEPGAEELKSKLVHPLEYTLSLAKAGLAEMRALIFELHPDALERDGLVAALKRRAAALQARHKLHVQVDLCEEPELAIDVKEAFYRIAQEALNNVAKHARATHVGVKLGYIGDMISLEIQDDGAGFDLQKNYPGHLGLKSMRERIHSLGGTFEIESEPGQGTRIRAYIQFNHNLKTS